MKQVILLMFLLPSLIVNQNARAQPVNLDSGLVAYYPFSGNTNDYSGSGNHSYNGGGVRFTTDRFNTINSCCYFDSKYNSYLYAYDKKSLRPDYITISAWILPENVSGTYSAIVAKRSLNQSANEQYNFTLEYDTKLIGDVKRNSNCIIGNNWFEVQSSVGEIPLLVWSHVVLVYELQKFDNKRDAAYKGVLKLYRNGILIAQNDKVPAGSIDNCIGSELLIGTAWKGVWQDANFKGKIDDIRIYNRALNNAEINELAGVKTTSVPDASVLVGDNFVHVYPNPSISGVFSVVCKSMKRVQITNNLGQVEQIISLKQNECVIDLSSSKKGIYFVNIETDNGRIITKIICL